METTTTGNLSPKYQPAAHRTKVTEYCFRKLVQSAAETVLPPGANACHDQMFSFEYSKHPGMKSDFSALRISRYQIQLSCFEQTR